LFALAAAAGFVWILLRLPRPRGRRSLVLVALVAVLAVSALPATGGPRDERASFRFQDAAVVSATSTSGAAA
jgi:peptidoglycan/LPS O-acetylase OafA/YrhL